jgi:ABC-type lipoprotein release transport system permease subunit
MNGYFFKLCWKNIWRNKRRTLITVNAIGLGVMALVFLRNYYDTFHEQVIQNVIRYHSGHLAISAKDFEKNHSTQIFVENGSQVSNWLKSRPEVLAASQRVLFSAMLSSARGSTHLMMMAVEPKAEAQVTGFSQKVIKGDFFKASKERSIILGIKAAETLSVDVGSKVVLLTQWVDGYKCNELFFVAGLFETQSEADKLVGLIQLNEGKTLLSLKSESFHQTAVVLKNDEEAVPFKALFENTFQGNSKLEMFSWKELQRPVVAMIELDRAVNRLLMILILCVAALGIANSILMSIMERTREFGVMLAIGTDRKEVIKMVVVETLLLTLVGVLLGNLFGWLVTGFFNQIGFDLRWLTAKDFVIQGAVVQTVSYPTIRFYNSLVVTAVILMLALLVSYFPARQAGNLTPMKALRSH